jgi:hypothetical protein
MARSYLDAMRAAFARALETGLERSVVALRLDDVVVRLEFAGRAMSDAVLPALGPVAVQTDAPPALTVELWDSASAGIPAPPVDWDRGAAAPLGALRGHNDGATRTLVDPVSRTITVADLDRRQAVLYSPAANSIPSWWRAMPMRFLLGWAVSRPDRHLVHAGAVGAGDRGVLLGGAGGAGKSTTAVTCLESGMRFVGDDYTVLSAGQAPRAHAVYGTAKLDRRSLEQFPSLARTADQQPLEDAKAVIDLHAHRRDGLADSVSVHGVVIPRVDPSGVTRIWPMPAAHALRELAPSTIFQEPDGRVDAFRVIADVVRRVPSYGLSMGRDSSKAPSLIRSVVEAAV